ncbi:glycosyltransferase family 4 protein [bacterium]|nr:glycosyltransferase family 4 protein [bacterium]
MRIAFFTTRMLLGYGVDLTVHELALRLTRRGHQVDVWTPTFDDTYLNQPYGLHKITVHGDSANRALPILERNAQIALGRLRRELAEAGRGYDVLLPCTHPYYAAGTVLDTPQVFFNFGNVPTDGFTWKRKLNWAWLHHSEDLVFKNRSARIVSISRFLHEQQTAEQQARGTVIHLGGDHYWPAWDLDPASSTVDAHYDRAALRSGFRERCGIPENALLLGYCGRLHRQHPAYKGTTEVMRLGRRLAERDSRIMLAMCGIGSEEDGHWVREQGALPLLNTAPADMPGFYASLDFYVTAARWEGFNLPILEAAWHGVPTVAYEVGAHAEHASGILVPELNYDELCRAALTMARDKALREDFGRQAWQRARLFSWDKAAAELEQVLEEARA